MRNTISFLALSIAILIAISAVAADKVVVIPLNSKNSAATPVLDGKLWGQGRVGASISNISYHSSTGVDYGTSNDAVTWEATHAACPANWWVCRESDLLGVTPTPNSIYTHGATEALSCDGSYYAIGNFWLADSAGGSYGKQVSFSEVDGMVVHSYKKCEMTMVLCCRLHKLIIVVP